MLIDLAFGAISFLGGWLLRITFGQINKIRDEHVADQNKNVNDIKELRNIIHELALSLPEKYVVKSDFDKFIEHFNSRFDKLEAKIDTLKSS